MPASTTRDSTSAAPPPLAVAATSIQASPKSTNVADSAPVPRLDVHITLVCEARYSMLSVLLLNATSPTTPDSMRLGDRDLVMSWLERNDAQNYILLGDPAARVRSDLLK
jgi:hypothetical protein